jgi:small subunit ribosomal protein S7
MTVLKLNNKNYKLNLHVGSRQFYFFYKLVNNLIVNGKKDTALNIMYNLIFLIQKNYKDKDPLSILDIILCKSIITVKVKKKRVAGRVHHVPLFLQKVNQINYSLKSFIDTVRLRSEKTMVLKLFSELQAILNQDNSAVIIKKKKTLYMQVLANKFYVKFL